MQRLGQHFLKNTRVIEKIINALEVSENDEVIEIGPGHGELTIPLLSECSLKGAALSVIEKDERLAEALVENVKTAASVTTGDALKILGGLLTSKGAENKRDEKHTPKHNVKLAGNLPYYITGKLLRIVGESQEKPERCVFMIQREVAERICATPPKMNRLAASVQFWADAKIITSVPRQDFSPPPEVESAVILLTTKDPVSSRELMERYYKAVRAIFAQPRKTLFNNIAATSKENGLTKEDLMKKMEKSGLKIDLSIRPQDLSIEEIAQLAAILF